MFSFRCLTRSRFDLNLLTRANPPVVPIKGKETGSRLLVMNETRLSHLPFWGPSEGFFLID